MSKRKSLTDAEGEVREITDADMQSAQSFSQLPQRLQSKLRRLRGPQKAPTKELISIRLPRDVVGRFRAGGPGWQGRMEEALRDWLKHHPH